MSNVIALSPPPQARPVSDQMACLAHCFAQSRRATEDVFWLKENAELLNVMETSGLTPGETGLAAYRSFYDDLPRRFAFFPQYYRFLLSICLDLEDLGLAGTTSDALIAQTLSQDLVAAELSDLQRAEAHRLLARRGAADKLGAGDIGLADRLRAFVARSATFALPNKKAAYELTHIVFYLSEYGRKAPDLPAEAEQSLHYIGILAYLEGNLDLLAETCIALSFAGWAVPEAWTAYVTQQTRAFAVSEDPSAPLADDYHPYMMGHWHGFLNGRTRFEGAIVAGKLSFQAPMQGPSALRELSELLFSSDNRSSDWSVMRTVLEADLSPHAAQILRASEAASPAFAAFFETFSRATGDSAAVLRAV